MRKLCGSLGFFLVVLLSGCSTGIVPNTIVAPSVQGLRGVVHGGQPAVTNAAIKLWSAGSTGDGSTGTLLTSTNSDSNGNFTLGTYTCPGSDPFVYLTATGGNPGMTAGTNNAAILMMAALTDCNTLKANAATTFVWVDEVTTMGAVAALHPYMTSTGGLGSGSADAAAFATAFGTVAEYTNSSTGSAPGPSLPAGFYASSTEINTLGNIIASCINTAGGVAGDNSACGNLFNLTKAGSVAPTNTLGAMLNIINNPTQNAAALFALASSVTPFQPVDSVAPTSWALPILPIAGTPTFLPVGGTYGAAQFVGISSTTSGAVIHYTTDGSTPTSTSSIYNSSSGAITVSSSETIKAIAQAGGYATSAVGTAAYTITGSNSTYSVGGQIIIPICGVSSIPTMTVTLTSGSTIVQTTTTNSSGNYTFNGVPNGTYTVTPSITGASSVFSPASQSVPVNGSNFNSVGFSANVGYTVSGTVTYPPPGAQSGQIYLSLNPTGCGGGGTVGTSISSPGAFTIHGVPPGSYTLAASMDNLGIGSPNGSNPTGSTAVTVTSSNYSGANVALADPPSPVTITTAPSIQGMSGFNTGFVAQYKAITINGVEQPSSYTLQWSTDPNFALPAGVVGSHTFVANGTKADAWFFGGLTNGSVYYFRAYGSSAGTPAGGPYSSIYGPVTIGAPSGGISVSGTVSFSQAPSGPMYVGFLSQTNGNFYAEYIASPVSAQFYSLQAPADTYEFFAILDQNKDGLIDTGDVQDATDNGSSSQTVVLTGPGPATESLTLPTGNATATVQTDHYNSISQSGSGQGYGLSFQIRGLLKRPVAVQLTSGPNLFNPIDIGACSGGSSSCGQGFQINFGIGSTAPNVGDTYNFNVTYSDTTTGTLSTAVTGVLNAFVTNPQPQTGTSSSTMPTFSWTYPANPGNYVYSFSLCCSTNGDIWDIPGNNSNSNGFTNTQIPLGQIPWNTDPTGGGSLPSLGSLSNTTNYSWQIQAQDSNGNSAQTQVQYQP
jgi:hypothetical protein